MNAKQKFWGIISAVTATLGIAGTAGLTTFQMMTTAAVQGGMELAITGTASLIGIGSAAGVSLLLAIPLFYLTYKSYVKKREDLEAKKTEETKKKNDKEEELNNEIYDLAINFIRLKLQQDKTLLDRNDPIVVNAGVFSGANIKATNDPVAKLAIDKKTTKEFQDLVNSISDKLRQDKLLGGIAGGAGLNTFNLWNSYHNDPTQKANLKTLRDELQKENKIFTAFDKFKNGDDESQQLIVQPKLKPKLRDSISAGAFGIFGFLSTFASVLGPAFTVSGLVIGTAAGIGTMLAVTPFIGWGILGGALLLSLAVGCAYAYYTNQNNKIKTSIASIRNETKQIESLKHVIHEYKMKVKHDYKAVELRELKQDKTNAAFASLDNSLQQAQSAKIIAEKERAQAALLAASESSRANAEQARANAAEARVVIAESQANAAKAEANSVKAEIAALRKQLELLKENAKEKVADNSSEHSSSSSVIIDDKGKGKQKEIKTSFISSLFNQKPNNLPREKAPDRQYGNG